MSIEDDFAEFRRVAGGEIAKLREENAELRAHAERVGEANDRLAVENAALRKDKERLDWLETQDCWIGVYGEYDINARICAGGSHSQRIRSAVDAARKEAQP